MVIFARFLSAAALSLIMAIAPAFAELPEYVEGEAIVVLRTDASSSAATLGAASAKSAAVKSSESLASSLGVKVVHNYRPVRKEADASGTRSLSLAGTAGTGGELYAVAHLRSAEGESTEDFIARLRENPNVVSATPNYIMRLSQVDAGNDGGAETGYRPDDPLYEEQWGLEKIGMPELWAQTMDAESEEVVVAVIDTGVLYYHEDLKDKMFTFDEAVLLRMEDFLIGMYGEDEEEDVINSLLGSHGVWFYTTPNEESYVSPIGPGKQSDADGITLEDVINGKDNVRYVGDIHGHGTHVAGIIGAATDNGIGVAGIAWNVKLMAVGIASIVEDEDKVGEYEGGSMTTSDIIRGYDFVLAAKEAGVNIRVANMSFGDWYAPEHDESDMAITAEALKIKALSDAGIILCIAAGNESQDLDNPKGDYTGMVSCPAMLRFDNDNIISVGASKEDDTKAEFSNYSSSGKWVDVFAPGNDIMSTCLYGEALVSHGLADASGYRSADGTSMAAPHAAGVAALLCSQFPEMSAGEIKQLILDGANGDVLKDSYSAYGLIDAYESWRIGTERAASSASGSGSGGGCNAGAGALLLFPLLFALRSAFKKER